MSIAVRRARATTPDSAAARALEAEGHRLFARALLPDDRHLLRALVSQWIADARTQPCNLAMLRLRLKE